MQTDMALRMGRVYYGDGTRATIGPGWTIIFHLHGGTLSVVEGTTKAYWGLTDHPMEQDDKLLVQPGGISPQELPWMERLARSIAQRHGCAVEQARLASRSIVAFRVVATA